MRHVIHGARLQGVYTGLCTRVIKAKRGDKKKSRAAAFQSRHKIQ